MLATPQIEWILLAVTGILAAVAIIARMIKPYAAVQDLLWRTSLIVVCALPLIGVCRSSLTQWQWSLPLLPAASVQTDRTSGLVATRPLRGARIPHSSETSFALPDRPEPTLERSTTDGILNHRQEPESVLNALDQIDQAPAPTTLRHDRFQWVRQRSWLELIAIVWLVGIGVHAIRIGRAAWNAARLRRNARHVAETEPIKLNNWCAQRVVHRQAAPLMFSSLIATPIVIGVLRPQVIVPSSLLASESRQDLRAALLHEYGHVRRHDVAFDLLLKIVLALFWFHPLVYWMASELRRLREELCDNYVLADEQPAHYAETLLRVAVGKRLNELSPLGIGMLNRPHQLEGRIESILVPDRLLDTRASRTARWLILGAASVALAMSLLVRIGAAVADPPPKNDAVEESAASSQSKPSTTTPQDRSTADGDAAPVVEPVKLRVRVVNKVGNPVVGAKVTPWGVEIEHGLVGSNEKWETLLSDNDGHVEIVCPLEVQQYIQASAKPVKKVAVRVDHPDHPVWSDYVNLNYQPTVVLADPSTFVIRARRVNETALATRLAPWFSGTHSADWSETDGVLTCRRVDLSDPKKSYWLRVVQVPEEGPVQFSDVIDLNHIAGDPITLDVALHPGVRVEGRLADPVPRPVQNGRVVALASLSVSGDSGHAWNATADIAADGTFVLESVPANTNLQLIALCDGWVSRSLTVAEMQAYAAENRFPISRFGPASPGQLLPQFYRLQDATLKPVITMVKTPVVHVTALDPEDRPIPGVTVQFNPNHVFYKWGSTWLGSGTDAATLLRAWIATGDHQLRLKNDHDEKSLTAETNAEGIATISGLPPGDMEDPAAIREIMIIAVSEKFIPAPESLLSKDLQFLDLFTVARLEPGDTSRITIRMIPQPNPSSDIGSDTQPERKARHSAVPGSMIDLVIAGRVIDAQGKPIEGVHVTGDEEFQPELDLIGGSNIRTDKNGRFRFKVDSCPADEEMPEIPKFVMKFAKEGFPTRTLQIRMNDENQTISLESQTFFEGVVRAPNGKPAANVIVRAMTEISVEPYSLQEVWTETKSDSQGHYKLQVEPGQYIIFAGDTTDAVAWLPKRSPDRSETIRPEERGAYEESLQPTFWMHHNEKKQLDIPLEPGVSFQARFIDSVTGLSVPDVDVHLRHLLRKQSMSKTDSSGSIILQPLPAAETRLTFHAEHYVRVGSEQAILDKTGVDAKLKRRSPQMASIYDGLKFDLKPGMPPVTILLERGVEIHGMILDPDGKPARAGIAPAYSPTTELSFNNERYRSHSDANGHFRLLVPPGDDLRFHLTVHDQRDDQHRVWSNGVSSVIEAKPGQSFDNIELRLTRPGIVRGRVVDAQGRPRAAIEVQSSAVDVLENSTMNPRTQSDRSGKFELRFVRPGRHRIHGKSAPGNPKTSINIVEFEVNAGQTTTLGDVVILEADHASQ